MKKTGASSPEKKIKDEIREAYAKTYPNCIFSLTNHIERLKVELAAKDEALNEAYEWSKYVGASKRENTQEFLDGLFERGERLQKHLKAALSPPTGKVLVDRELLDDAISLGQLLMWDNHPPDVFTKLRDLLYTNEWTDSCDPAPCRRGLVGEKETK